MTATTLSTLQLQGLQALARKSAVRPAGYGKTEWHKGLLRIGLEAASPIAIPAAAVAALPPLPTLQDLPMGSTIKVRANNDRSLNAGGLLAGTYKISGSFAGTYIANPILGGLGRRPGETVVAPQSLNVRPADIESATLPDGQIVTKQSSSLNALSKSMEGSGMFNSPRGIIWTALSTASFAASVYHGYKRNDSIGWAIWWGLMGGLFPVITPVVAVAQGFGKKAGSK